MSHDFSLIAQLTRQDESVANATSNETLELVSLIMKSGIPKTKAQIAKEIGRAESGVGDSLKKLKAKIYDKKGPKRAARWVVQIQQIG